MKPVFLTWVLLCSTLAMATEDKFEARKERILGRVKTHMTSLEKTKECVSAATTQEALNVCQQKSRQERQDRKMASSRERSGK